MTSSYLPSWKARVTRWYGQAMCVTLQTCLPFLKLIVFPCSAHAHFLGSIFQNIRWQPWGAPAQLTVPGTHCYDTAVFLLGGLHLTPSGDFTVFSSLLCLQHMDQWKNHWVGTAAELFWFQGVRMCNNLHDLTGWQYSWGTFKGAPVLPPPPGWVTKPGTLLTCKENMLEWLSLLKNWWKA